MELSAKHMQLLENRGIEVEMASRLGWHSSNDNLVIPYFQGGKQVGAKYRTLDGEKKFYQEKGSAQIFYNWDAMRETGPEPLIITEGEMDCAIALQCGLLAVSVPNGAPMTQVENGDTKYAYLADLPDDKEIILAVDGDSAGANLLHDLSLRIGQHRCRWIRYPEGTKDLNEVFLLGGSALVVETIQKARWTKIDGMYRMSELPDQPEMQAYECPIEGVGALWSLRQGDLSVVTGIPGHGKALAIDTPIPTTRGFVPMGKIKVGDQVFDETGKICKVTFATETMHNRECFELKFSNGQIIIADSDHQWFTVSEKARRSALESKSKRNDREETKPKGTDQRHLKTYPSVITTLEISKSITSQGKTNHQIPLALGIKTSKKQLPINPYVLGIWLGDGCSAGGRIAIGEVEMIAQIEKCGYSVSSANGKGLCHTIYGISTELRKLKLLKNKHIPSQYLWASFQQRLALLQGLLDTDGHCEPKGQVEFCNTNKILADQVYDLVSSLGIRASFYTGNATLNGKFISKKYRVSFYTNLPVFRLKRKLARVSKNPLRSKDHRIVSCIKVPSVPVRCIQVSSPNSLYLCSRSFIPTHNTTLLNHVIGGMALRHKWDVAIASFEQNTKLDHRRALRSFYHSKMVKDMTHEEKQKADAWIEEKFTFIKPSLDDEASLKWVLDKARAAILRHGAKLIVIDPWNEMDHDRPDGMNVTEYAGFAIKQFKRLAHKYLVHVCIVAHPAKLQRNREGLYPIPSLYDISDSAHFFNKPDIGIVVHRNEDGTMLFRVQKCRYIGTIGRIGEAKLRYDPEKNALREAFDAF